MKELRTKSLKSVLWLVIIAAAGLAVALYFIIPSALKQITGGKDFNELDYTADDLDGTYVSGTLYYIYDWYCQDRGTDGGQVEAREYIIDAGSDYYMGFRVDSAHFDEAEELMNVSYDWSEGNASDDELAAATYEVKGTIRAMPEESRELWDEYWAYYEDDELTAMTIPYYLELNYVGGTSPQALLIARIGALIAIFFLVFPLVKVFTGGYQSQVKNYIAKSANPDATREKVELFLRGNEYVKGLKMNAQYITGQQGPTTIFADVSTLAWVYQLTTTHKRNGFTTGHTYSLMFGFTDGTRKQLDMSNEENVKYNLQAIADRYPHVIVGFSNDLDNLFRKNIQEFLNLKYRDAMMRVQMQLQNDPYANI